MGLVDKIRAKYEVYRLENRYTRSRESRTTFYSDAIYHDGEYIYSGVYNTAPRKNTNNPTWTLGPSPSNDTSTSPTSQRGSKSRPLRATQSQTFNDKSAGWTHSQQNESALGKAKNLAKRMSSIHVQEVGVSPVRMKRRSVLAMPVSANLHTGWNEYR